MIISFETKQAIISEYNSQKELQYAGKSREERKKMDQFYTEPAATITMLEKLPNLEGSILDPTCGSGNLLAAAIIAGADPKKCYGVELDLGIVEVCRDRLENLGVPRENIRWGNALNPGCFDFEKAGYSFDPNQGENGTAFYNGKLWRRKATSVFGKRK